MQLVVRAFGGTALGIRAREVVGGRLHLGFVFVFVARLFRLNECRPFFGVHVLMRHKRQLVRLNLFARDPLHYSRVGHIDAHRAQSVGVNLNEIPVLPFLHDVFGVRFLQGVIVNAAFQIESGVLRGRRLKIKPRETRWEGALSCFMAWSDVFIANVGLSLFNFL